MNVSGLSGGQIDWLLGNLLERALRPLAESSYFLRKLAGELLCQPFFDLRRKISATKREEANCQLFAVILSKDSNAQLFNFLLAKIERNLIHSALIKVAKHSFTYRESVINHLRSTSYCPEIDYLNKLTGSNRYDLFTALAETELWIGEYEKFRNLIILQFEGLARSQTDSIIRNTSLNIDSDDMYKNMMLGVQRAVDKYSSHKGTLISYVRMWMMDAHTNPQFNHEYGNAFSVSAGERRRITTKINEGNHAVSNLSVDIDEAYFTADDITPEKILMDDNTGVKISHILNKLPLAKFAFLTMNIPYFLSPTQKQELLNTNK